MSVLVTQCHLGSGSFGIVAVEEPGFSPAKPRSVDSGFSRGNRG